MRLTTLYVLALPVTWLLSSVGCTPANVEGEVDGEAVAALTSASFTEATLGDGDGARTVVTSTAMSVLDGCGVVTRLQEKRNAAFAAYLEATEDETDSEKINTALLTYAEAQVDAAKSETPATFWSATLSATALDEDDIEGASSEIDPENLDIEEDVLVSVRVCRTNAYPTVEESNGIASVKEDQDCFVAENGDVEVETFVENQTIVAHATGVKLVDAEGEDAGEIALHVSASHCPSLEKALQDFEEVSR